MHKEITIIGPGLIGASLGLALKEKNYVKKLLGLTHLNKIFVMLT